MNPQLVWRVIIVKMTPRLADKLANGAVNYFVPGLGVPCFQLQFSNISGDFKVNFFTAESLFYHKPKCKSSTKNGEMCKLSTNEQISNQALKIASI